MSESIVTEKIDLDTILISRQVGMEIDIIKKPKLHCKKNIDPIIKKIKGVSAIV